MPTVLPVLTGLYTNFHHLAQLTLLALSALVFSVGFNNFFCKAFKPRALLLLDLHFHGSGLRVAF